MNRLSTVLALAFVSALATPVVVGATGLAARDAAPATQVASVKAEAPAVAAEPTCERRIKVVYPVQGTGTTACAAPSLELRR